MVLKSQITFTRVDAVGFWQPWKTWFAKTLLASCVIGYRISKAGFSFIVFKVKLRQNQFLRIGEVARLQTE